MNLNYQQAGVVVRGTGAASGRDNYKTQGGTIRMQRPFFEKAGLDFGNLWNGTINVDVSPARFVPVNPYMKVQAVDWDHSGSPEDFSFFRVNLEHAGDPYDGYVYLPHPETKKGVFPGFGVLELIMPKIPGLAVGSLVVVTVVSSELVFVYGEDIGA